MNKRAVILFLAAAGTVIAAACGDDDDTTAPIVVSKIVNLTATLTPAGEPGPLAGNPTGSGTFTATLDTSTNVLTYSTTFTGLTSNVTLGHIHGPFPSGTANTAAALLNFDPTITNSPLAAGAVFNKGATSGVATGSALLVPSTTLTTAVNGDSLKKLILAGLTYVNIHTQSNGGGEIRGQLTIKP
jgi:hypothetical protein